MRRPKNYSRWVLMIIVQLVVFSVCVVIFIFKGTRTLKYGLKYAEEIIASIGADGQRREDNLRIMSEMQWDFMKIQEKYMWNECRSRKAIRDVMWLSVLVNDEYVIPAVVLGHTIRVFSCVKTMTVFVSNEVSKSGQKALEKVGWSVKEVEAMDCHWMEKKLGKELSINDGIIGTHTRFHAWNYTHYRKIIYADPDIMLMSNMDELFAIPDEFAAAYCGRSGMVDPCFNAGLLVFKPSHHDYEMIMKMWHHVSQVDACPNDQRLLWHYYADRGLWKPLSFAYNVRRILHHPMKAYHFVRYPLPKPWKTDCRPSRKEAFYYDSPITDLYGMTTVFWKRFYAALDKYDIDKNWWRNTEFFKSDLEFGSSLFMECLFKKDINIIS
ncbi:glycogenin-1-like [Nematostella vectensis]|uniref:glycogenin-1-like n=1 Tax=Nematostella vectensis TaxID=45351 RepID=UPI002076FD4A|nr:glycogenin-1-like [Nematostella vectensis]